MLKTPSARRRYHISRVIRYIIKIIDLTVLYQRLIATTKAVRNNTFGSAHAYETSRVTLRCFFSNATKPTRTHVP